MSYSTLPPDVARLLLRYEIDRLCKRAGATHAEMGERLGTSRAAFTQIISGKTLPSKPAVEVIGRYLGSEPESQELIEILEQAKKGPPPSAAEVRHGFKLTWGLCHTAKRIEIFSQNSIPSFLQTSMPAAPRTSGAELRPNADAIVLCILNEQALLASASCLQEIIRPPRSEILILPSTAPKQLSTSTPFVITHRADGTCAAHENTRYFSYTYSLYGVVQQYRQLLTELRREAQEIAPQPK
ncbi:helix-turn-helix domain-containing protein [Actinokineospora sp. 24-640]